jgi:hypothetical protein
MLFGHFTQHSAPFSAADLAPGILHPFASSRSFPPHKSFYAAWNVDPESVTGGPILRDSFRGKHYDQKKGNEGRNLYQCVIPETITLDLIDMANDGSTRQLGELQITCN